MSEPMDHSILEKAEAIESMTEGRIPFDRACWVALAIENGTTVNEEIRRDAKSNGREETAEQYIKEWEDRGYTSLS